MQFKIISMACTGDAGGEEELNRFLRSHRAVSVQRELVQNGSAAYWSFCIEYIGGSAEPEDRRSGRRRIDYKEVLSEPDFALYAQLRDVRKRLSTAESVPVYAICTNEQLANMAKNRTSTVADLKQIDGFGDAKAEKYGNAFLAALNAVAEKQQGDSTHAASGEPD